MKKLLLLCSVVVSFLASEAQTTKSHTKKVKQKKISIEEKMQARMDSLEAARQLRIDSMLLGQLRADSVRKLNDSLAYAKLQEDRKLWQENKGREVDSANKAHTKMLSMDHEKALSIQRERTVINKTAKLNDYQGQQVNYINQLYFGRAQKIRQDSFMTEDKKKQELVKLNDERVNRLKTVIGKSKERKLEKARKAHNNSNDTEVQWINEVDGLAKN